MSDKLKPCPFCGSEDVINSYCFDNTNWAVVCKKCDAEGPSDLGKSGAIEAWNTRPLEDKLLEALEKCNHALELYRKATDWHSLLVYADQDLIEAHWVTQAAIRAAEGD